MSEITDLRRRVYSTTHAQRELVVAYVKALGAEAKRLSPGEREVRGNYTNGANKFPQTSGEAIASDIQSSIAQQDWISYDTADDLEEISEIAGSLEINTDDPELWRELFQKIRQLNP